MPRQKKVQEEPQLLSDSVDLNASIDYEKLGDLASPIPGVDAAETPRKRKGRPAKKQENVEEKVESAEKPHKKEKPSAEANAAEEIPAAPKNEAAAAETPKPEQANSDESRDDNAGKENNQNNQNGQAGGNQNNGNKNYNNNGNNWNNNNNNWNNNKYNKKNNKFKNRHNRNLPQDDFIDESIQLPPPDPEKVAQARAKWRELRGLPMFELQQKAEELGIEDNKHMRKQTLIYSILTAITGEDCPIYTEGVLEIIPEGGHGFLRNPDNNYQAGPDDIYISRNIIRRYDLKVGDTITGQIRQPREGEKYFALMRIDTVNFEDPEKNKRRVAFEYLTPIHPNEKITLEWNKDELTTRVMDLFSPIGKGQRSIILAPPRTGKTILLQNMVRAIASNHPEITIIVLLIDERPEEVTEMREIVMKLVEKNPALKAEVVASTFDEPPEHHARVATMVLEKSKRLVEQQKDVVVLLDSITRFARANNVVIPHSGKILSGGVDANAMQFPKKFFGAARKIADKLGDYKLDSNGQILYNQEGEPEREILQKNGSLTIIGTALIETGSRMDEVIFEEFKGTGNMELVLDRRLAERRTWPAIDIFKSGTRKEERLLTLYERNIIWKYRHEQAQKETEGGAMDKIIKLMHDYKTNRELLMFLEKGKNSV